MSASLDPVTVSYKEIHTEERERKTEFLFTFCCKEFLIKINPQILCFSANVCEHFCTRLYFAQMIFFKSVHKWLNFDWQLIINMATLALKTQTTVNVQKNIFLQSDCNQSNIYCRLVCKYLYFKEPMFATWPKDLQAGFGANIQVNRGLWHKA